MKERIAISWLVVALAACTTKGVRPVDPTAHRLSVVCIEENPKVIVDGFITVLEEGFARHSIRTRIVQSPSPPDCEYTLWYTARQSWDFVSFLRSAELRLRRGDETIGTATYRHRGGLAPSKWASPRSKMAPVLDELLAGFTVSSTAGASPNNR
jgi:hypothetical protein